MGFFRPTFAEIDLKALIHNLNAAVSCAKRGVGVMAMVKADAYGHGAVPVSRKLVGAGVEALGVAMIEEGLELRESGIDVPIVVMGGLMGMGGAASKKIVEAGLVPVVHSSGAVGDMEAAAARAGKVVGIHLKIDTGMTRLGALPKDIDNILIALQGCKHLRLDGVMTHLADAEGEEYTRRQMKIFADSAKKIKKVWGDVDIWHIANSAATIDGRYLDGGGSRVWVRPGLMLYGSYPAPRFKKGVELRPVMSLKSRVALVKTVPEGTKVSYGCTFETRRRTRTAVIPMGYADGYPWSLSNKGVVLINGRRVPVIGRVTMDMIIVDATDVDCGVGDDVVLMGRQGSEEITADEIASLAGTISYEIFCGVSKRMPRVYVG